MDSKFLKYEKDMKKINSIMFVLLFGALFTGCINWQKESLQTVSLQNRREVARDLIQNDWDLFANFSHLNFTSRVSQSFQPDKTLFLTKIEESFYESRPIELSFSLDKVLIQDNKLAVSFTWQKKVANRLSGSLNLKEGEGSIIYIREKDIWLIYQVQGDSIFTF